MKLSTIALSTIATLALVTVGGSWYSGQIVQEKYNDITAFSNQNLAKLQAYGINAKISNVQYQHNFFDSNVKYDIETTYLGESYTFIGRDTIYHGPFPLNKLKSFNFIPQLLSIESRVFSPEKLQSVFNNRSIILSNINIAYSGNINGSLFLNPIKLEKDNVNISNSELRFDLDTEKNGNLVLILPSLELKTAKGTELNLKAIQLSYDINKSNEFNQLNVGNSIMNAKTIDIKNNDLTFKLANVLSQNSSKLNKDRFESSGYLQSQVELQNKNGEKINLGKFHLDMSMNLDALSVNNFMPSAWDNASNRSPVSIEALQKIIENNPTLNIKSFFIENERGRNELTLALNLEKFDANILTTIKERMNIIQKSKLGLKLNAASTEEFLKQIMIINGENKENATSQAKILTEQLANDAKSLQLVELDGNNFIFRLDLDQGKVKLNDQPLPDDQARSALVMIASGLLDLIN